MRKIFLNLITFYQKHISPFKGYSCAYGLLHQNGSCSTRIYSIIQNSPQTNLLPEISAQFKACQKAHLQLSSENDKEKTETKKENNNKDHYACIGSECSFWVCLGIFS